ncbi:MAG: AAA family ATPase [Candidatus Eremiobacteraeota bacterium]|nr:AAA family ATPase [Candidatus Eremiobacteraeota bacterium]
MSEPLEETTIPPETQGAEQASIASVTRLFMGRRPLIYLTTCEEDRALDIVSKASQLYSGKTLPLHRWSPTKGLAGAHDALAFREPLALLEHIAAQKDPCIFFLGDFHTHFHGNPAVTRKIRDLYYDLFDRDIFIVLVGSIRDIPPEAEHEIASIVIEPPDISTLRDLIKAEIKRKGAEKLGLEEQDMANAARTLQGLTQSEARHALLCTIASSGGRNDFISNLQKEKKLHIKKESPMEYISHVTPFGHIGGLKNLKDWLTKRKSLMHMEGAYSSEIIPKGILLMGIAGCGKSLSVKAIASLWELPLYRMDMIKIYSGVYGKPEEAFINACRTMEEVSPAVLWFDEIEMGIELGETHSGEAARIFGFFLTWMQEKRPGLFLAATANRIDLLPAEILRRGRFDQIFFIDLPTEDERLDIFRIHLEKRGHNPDSFDLKLLVDLTDGCNGAEIEQCVISAVVESRIGGRELTQKDIIAAKRLIVPLSKTMGEQIRRIKQWAFNRATPAS